MLAESARGGTWDDALRGNVGEGDGRSPRVDQGPKMLQHGHVRVRRRTQGRQVTLHHFSFRVISGGSRVFVRWQQ